MTIDEMTTVKSTVDKMIIGKMISLLTKMAIDEVTTVEDTIDEIKINRYKPAGGLFNLYTNNLLSLPPKQSVDEYGSVLDEIIEVNKQNQTK